MSVLSSVRPRFLRMRQPAPVLAITIPTQLGATELYAGMHQIRQCSMQDE